jgi:hypothetical protein
MVTVRYGLYVDSAIEWINAGTFYLTEWRTPSNGIAASFEARDVFEFMLNEEYTGIASGTAEGIIQSALSVSSLPTSFSAVLDPSLKDVNVAIPTEKPKAAEVIQMCANKACCVIYQDRNGVLRVEPLNTAFTDYVISSFLSYSHPEVELSKPLKNVSVSYGNQNFVLGVASSGETQTVSNPLVTTAAEAEKIATWVKSMLERRTLVTGEFRGDPCLDLYDVVTVESKYGEIAPVVITDIKYSCSGAFRASYSGRELRAVLDQFILDVDVLS